MPNEMGNQKLMKNIIKKERRSGGKEKYELGRECGRRKEKGNSIRMEWKMEKRKHTRH